jgi:hypothetical protein
MTYVLIKLGEKQLQVVAKSRLQQYIGDAGYETSSVQVVQEISGQLTISGTVSFDVDWSV